MNKISLAFISLCLAILSGVFFSIACNAATLEKIIVQTTEDETQIELLLDEKVRFTQQVLPAKGNNRERCYIDLSDTQKAPSVQSRLLVESNHVEKIRTGIHATKLRVVFDLSEQYPCTIQSSEDSFRLQVTFSSNTSQTAEIPNKDTEQNRIENIADSTPALQQTITIEMQEETAAGVPSLAQADKNKEADFFFTENGHEESNKPAFWGWLQFFTAHDTKQDKAEDSQFSRGRARIGTDWEQTLTGEQSLQFKGTVDIDRIFYDAKLADEETEFNLYETYLQLRSSNWDISFGKQRVRWGKSDQLSPVDTINPQDYRQSMAVDLEERAIPSWMMRSRWYGEGFGLETIIQPWFEKSQIEYFDSDWALYRNLRRTILENPSVPAFLKDYTSTLHVDENEPSKKLENLSAGARLTLQTAETDFAISYHYGWETLPTITSFPVSGIDYNGDPNTDAAAMLAMISLPTSNKIEATYKRQQTVGFEWESSALDPIGFRGEIAHIDKVSFLSSDLTSKRKQVTHLVTGVDYTSESEWYFNVQGSWQYIHNFEKEILYFEENTFALLGEISKPIWRGNIELATKYNYVITDQSSYLQPSATLKYFQNVEFEIGAMIYSGKGETLLGSYDQADQIYGIVKVSF